MCAVFLCDRTTGWRPTLLWQLWVYYHLYLNIYYGIFNVCTNLGVTCHDTHEGGSVYSVPHRHRSFSEGQNDPECQTLWNSKNWESQNSSRLHSLVQSQFVNYFCILFTPQMLIIFTLFLITKCLPFYNDIFDRFCGRTRLVSCQPSLPPCGSCGTQEDTKLQSHEQLEIFQWHLKNA